MCNKEDCPVVPYGTGTGLEAGISALYGGVSIDLSKMDDIHDYNPEDFDVKVIIAQSSIVALRMS